MTNAFEYIYLIIYLFALLALFTYGMNCYFLMVYYRLNYRKAIREHKEIRRKFDAHLAAKGWPRVTIQLPIYNERYVVERLISSVCRLDYPGHLLEIQVLDDSTDDTVSIAKIAVKRLRARGFDIVYLNRNSRTGFKAGALEKGLKSAKGELIAIFDADFLPGPAFLKETVPYFIHPEVGMLQTRWGHLNSDYSMLTRAQSIGIDGHFSVEQASRAWGGLFMNFNGTAGIWRKAAIEDAGGWQADTLIPRASQAQATSILARFSLSATFQAASQVIRPSCMALRMADSRSWDTFDDACIALPFLSPYPKSPIWHLLIRFSKRSMFIPTRFGAQPCFRAISWAAAQVMRPSFSLRLISSAMAAFTFPPGCLAP